MPSRTVTIFILLGWVGVTIWFLQRDFLPRLNSDGAPSYTINQLDEIRQRPSPHWHASRFRNVGERDRYPCDTRIRYRDADDTFTFATRIEIPPPVDEVLSDPYYPLAIRSRYRCTRDGRLKSFELTIIHYFSLIGLCMDFHVTHVRGVAQGNRIYLSWEREWDNTIGTWDPITVSYPRRFLIPLNPVLQMRDLRPGQRWKEPTIDLVKCHPLSDFSKNPPIRWVQAEVLDQAPVMVKYRDTPKPCQVVEYTAEQFRAQLFVQESIENPVIRYELHQPGEDWVLTQ